MEEKQTKTTIRNIFKRDHSFTINFLFVVIIYILVMVKNNDSFILSLIFLLVNGVIGIQQHILKRHQVIIYQRICLIASKFSLILLILFVDHELIILILVAFERLDLVKNNKNNIRQYDHLTLRFLTLLTMFFDYNIFVIIAILHSILIEINRLIIENQSQEKREEETFPGLLTTVDNHWTSRLSVIPSCYIIINSETQVVTYKNSHTLKFFSLFYTNDNELDEIILNKLQFRLVKDKIEQIKSFSKIDKKKKNVSGKENRWTFKRDSVSQQFSPANNIDQLKQYDSLDFITAQEGFSLIDVIQKKKFSQFKNLMSQNFVEVYCDQSWSTLEPQVTYSFTLKKIQLYGQVIDNTKENEIIVVLKDMQHYNELQQVIQNDEFKSKIIQSFSHELRTPLNSTINFLTSAIQDDGSFQDVKEDLIIPAINSLKMQSYFINDIIDLSQIYSNDFKIQTTEFTLRELITEITSIFKIQFEMKGLELCVDLIDNNATVLVADYTRLVSVLVNLLQNSLKFSMQGVIILKITSCQNNTLKFSVSDQGFGIVPDHLSQLQFLLLNIDQEKDIQINQSWKGFGLLISAILVSRLAPSENKIIQLNSNGKDQGTEVSFYLQNHINKPIYLRQTALRQSFQRFQSSQEDSLKLDINGLIYQATEVHFSKQLISEYSYMKNSIMKNSHLRPRQPTGKQKSNENLPENKEDDNSYDDLHLKYLQLSPLAPSLITDKLFQFSKDRKVQSVEYSNRQSYRKIALAEAQIEEDFQIIYHKKKKCDCQNIMSVDDEIFNQRSIQILLTKLGFNVILAFNGEQALQRITEIQPCSSKCQYLTLILMDYQMPIMDGPTTTKKIVEMINQGSIPKVHIVGLTAFTGQQDIDKCIQAGMSDVLAKPLNLKRLKEILMLIF